MQQQKLINIDTNFSFKKNDNSSTFTDNMSLPVHRWFKYSAGFSAEWVENIIIKYSKGKDLHVLDPFAGSGTTLFASEHAGVLGLGVETHPFVSEIVRCKLLWRTDSESFKLFAKSIIDEARKIKGSTGDYPKLIKKCYTEDSLIKLDSLKKSLENNNDDSSEYKLSWLALTSILRITSNVGTANWQYILPKKKKVRCAHPFVAYDNKIYQMINDMKIMQYESKGPPAQFFEEDARKCRSIPNDSIDLVITSPPYTNNYDYADATRLEMSFFGEIKLWGDLQDKVRKHLIHSCTQHVTDRTDQTYEIIDDNLLYPIKEELLRVCRKLDKEKEKHGGKKNYHTMIALYFYDLSKVWIALRKKCKDGSNVCFVVGDSAPYGIHVPTDKWLGELAIAAGFKKYNIEKIRDRNRKWKLDRKHNVPLHEVRLWVEG